MRVKLYNWSIIFLLLYQTTKYCNVENLDKIESYLDGEMPENQKIAFENELKTNAILRDDFEKRQTLKLSLQHLMKRDQKKEELKRWLREQKDVGKSNVPKPKLKAKPRVVDFYFSLFRKMAAAILIMAFPLGLYLAYNYFNVNTSPEMLAETAWAKTDKLSNLANTMGGEDSKSILKNVRKLYQEKKYDEGIIQLNKIESSNSDYPQSLLLKGMCYYKLDDNTSAIRNFSNLLEHPNKSFDDKANWFLALSLLDNGNKSAAQKILEEIVKTKSTHWDQAKTILDSL